MIFYISDLYKKFVTRNNALTSKPVKIFNHTVDEIEVSIVDQQNQLKQIPSGAFYFTGSFVKKAKATPIFFTTDYTVSGTTLTFKYSTYTYEFLNLIIGENVPIQVEIGYKDADGEHVILQDTAYASQRYYVEGMPDPSHVAEYYTKTETDAAIQAAISGIELSGYATEEQLEEGLATKQNTIDEDNKLPYSLISDTPEIPLSTSQLTNDSGFITDAALEGLATEAYVDGAVSGKADETALSTHTSDATIHVTAEDKEAWNGKQDAITVDNKLDYTLLSGTPEVPTVEWGGISGTLSNQTDLQNALNDKANASDIPLSTSQLTNDSGFITSSEMETALSSKQDVIDNNNKLDYALLSGAPTVPTSTSQLTNDSDFVTSSQMDTALSGKQDLITGDNWLPASYVRMELDPYEYGDPEFTVDNAVNIVNVEALTALSGVDAVSGALSGKQDAITNDNKLDYSLLSGTPSIPLSTSELINDSDFQTSTDVANAISGKAEQTDVAAISAELDEVNDVLENYTLAFTPFFIEAREANANISLAATGTPSAVYLKYSTDNENWSDYTVGNTITLTNAGDRVYFKGNNTSFTQNIDSAYHAFTCSAKTNVGGNIMSLLDETVRSKTIEANHALACLFKNNTNIVDASKIQFPATTLGNNCYQQMFYGCTALTIAPKELPAKEMKATCYAQMFQGCSSLATTPKILAETILSGVGQCLYGMFRNCTSLIKAPEINIRSITDTGDSVFAGLFRGCTNLNEVRIHFTDWGDANYDKTINWLRDVAASGTFYCPSGLNTETRGNNTVPENWTVTNI